MPTARFHDDGPVNRTLTITVTFNCVHRVSTDGGYGGTATYALTASSPPAGNIVDADGTINVNNMPQFDPNQFNESVDVSFVLVSPATVHTDSPTGPVEGTIGCVWAHVNGAPITITTEGGSPAPEFTVMAMTNPNVVHVIDNDDDTNSYKYCLAVELPSLNNYYIALDPGIKNGPPPH
jgi:hypothetical protein